MSGDAYYYVVPYGEGPEAALEALIEREFHAGRYYPASKTVQFPLSDESPAPGPKHANVAAARRAAGARGTCSILDVDEVGVEQRPFVAERIAEALLKSVLGTTRPSRAQVFENLFFLTEDLERGRCRYIVLHADDRPQEILFVGISYD
jgi:hypothetical protein